MLVPRPRINLVLYAFEALFALRVYAGSRDEDEADGRTSPPSRTTAPRSGPIGEAWPRGLLVAQLGDGSRRYRLLVADLGVTFSSLPLAPSVSR